MRYLRNTILILLVVVSIGYTSASGQNLVEVFVPDREAAVTLSSLKADVLLRSDRGYLILQAPSELSLLSSSGLEFQVIAEGVDRSELVIDRKLDHTLVRDCETVFEDSLLRLLRIEVSSLRDNPSRYSVMLLPEKGPRVVSPDLPRSLAADWTLPDDVDSVIAGVSQDSLVSYIDTLESYIRRTATSDNYYARQWIISHLEDFGLDSVYEQVFWADIYGTNTRCKNVIAVKPGSVFPRHHVVVGAHFDAVEGSPGADDNGSGTAAVMEIARVLADYDNRLTLVFILFDAEEYGALGAYHYAGEAADRGDSVVMMINLDMIAHIDNTDTALVYWARDSVGASIWREIGAGIGGLNLVAELYEGSAPSDQMAFDQSGYATTFAVEKIMSPYWHQSADSAVYLNFDYFTRMAKASLGTMYAIDASHVAGPQLWLRLITECGDAILPEMPAPITIEVVEYAGDQIVPGSVEMHYSIDNDPAATISMAQVDDSTFSATLPPLGCLQRVSIWFEATGQNSGLQGLYSYSEPLAFVAATHFETIFQHRGDSLPQDWISAGDGSSMGKWATDFVFNGDMIGNPSEDYDGTHLCYSTGGYYAYQDVDFGCVFLTSPQVNLSDGFAILEYARWFNNADGWGAPNEDSMYVEISDNGGATWHTADIAGPTTENDGGWYFKRLVVDDFTSDLEQVRFRFTACDEGDDSNVEASLDAIRLLLYDCRPFIVGDDLPDWTVGQDYMQHLDAVGGEGTLTWSDPYGYVENAGLQISTDGTIAGTPSQAGSTTLVIRVTDEAFITDQREYNIMINEPVQIITAALAEFTEGVPIAVTLQREGGTSPFTWSEIGENLATLGLALTADGVLTGTPVVTGSIEISVRVDDVAGSYDEQTLVVTSVPEYICGDIDDSRTEIDISDLTFLVDYLFAGGSPPPHPEAADIDNSGSLDISDLTYFVTYLFDGGPAPVCD